MHQEAVLHCRTAQRPQSSDDRAPYVPPLPRVVAAVAIRNYRPEAASDESIQSSPRRRVTTSSQPCQAPRLCPLSTPFGRKSVVVMREASLFPVEGAARIARARFPIRPVLPEEVCVGGGPVGGHTNVGGLSPPADFDEAGSQ